MNQKHIDYMRKNKWIIEKQGREFVKFGGLLWLAHQMGLTSIVATPVIEDYEKFFFAFEATAKGVRMINDKEQIITFTDQGDASPKNVGKMIHPHLRRMASTRAMARALRLFTGCGITAFEEVH
jgi:hypothetical protein